MSANEYIAALDMNRLRKEAMTRRILDTLHGTIRTWSGQDYEDLYYEFTDESASVIAPLVEALDILEAIIWASDGCVGHRHCAHSMEPWQRARRLLESKWKEDEERLLGTTSGLK